MSKFIACLLLFLFISGTVIVAFNPVTASEAIENSWHTKTPMAHERSNFDVVAVEGKIYAIGGDDKGTVECYDPATDKWTTRTSLPTTNMNAFVTFQNKIYYIAYAADEGTFTGNMIYVYDPTTDIWSAKIDIPNITGWISQAQVIDEKIFVLTVKYVDLEVPNTYGPNTITTACPLWYLYMYNPIEDSWIEKAKIPFFSPNHATDIVFVAVDDKLMVFGTFYTKTTLTLANNNLETKILAYNSETDKWTDEGTTPITFGHIMSSFRPIMAMTSGVYAPQKIYFFSDMTSTTLVYDPADNVWSTAETLPAPGNGNYATATVDDIIYVMGEGHTYYSSGLYHREYLNLQYIPIGYHGTLPSTGLSINNPIHIAVITTLTISIVGASLFYYRSKKMKVMCR